MARASITAPLSPSVARRAEADRLRSKAGGRTPADTARYVQLLEAEVAELRARLEQLTAAR